MLTQLNLLKRKTESLTTDVLLLCLSALLPTSLDPFLFLLETLPFKNCLNSLTLEKERMLIFNIFCITIVKME